MGFNKMYVPELEELKKEIKNNPKLLNYLQAADSLVGPSNSMEYIKEKIQEKIANNR